MLDVLPKNALEDLTAEDFRLLVNGCGEVNVQMLISFTSFNDESGLSLSAVYVEPGSTLMMVSFLMFLPQRIKQKHLLVLQGKMQINYSSLSDGFGP